MRTTPLQTLQGEIAAQLHKLGHDEMAQDALTAKVDELHVYFMLIMLKNQTEVEKRNGTE